MLQKWEQALKWEQRGRKKFIAGFLIKILFYVLTPLSLSISLSLSLSLSLCASYKHTKKRLNFET
jgi:hypothetical protein